MRFLLAFTLYLLVLNLRVVGPIRIIVDKVYAQSILSLATTVSEKKYIRGKTGFRKFAF